METARKPYHGRARGLVLAFDVGTTYSGISYAKLEPGLPPTIESVTRFPGQESAGANAKVPTVIYYDRNGEIKAVGADTTLDTTLEQANDEKWFRAEWQAHFFMFKLHLRPQGPASQTYNLPPLPPRKDPVDVLSDFLRYLLRCAEAFITELDANGNAYWDAVSDKIIFVLTHPNGWEHEQQSYIRQAAMQAELIPDNQESQDRINFVTEGEASLHYCIHQGLREHVETEDGSQKGIVVVDAGGGTIDISSYRNVSKPQTSQLEFEETCIPQCHFEGSVMVSLRARHYIADKLASSNFKEDIDNIVDKFDQGAKHSFSGPGAASLVKFGGVQQNDRELGIKRGALKIEGDKMAEFFDPSIISILEALKNIQLEAPIPISSVFLVGGFAASGYLFSKLKEFTSGAGIQVCRPDRHVNKAVAGGAMSFYLDHFVANRIARMTYGLSAAVPYDSENIQHKKRFSTRKAKRSGVRIPGQFSPLLLKGTVVSETKEFRRPYVREAASRRELYQVKIPLYVFLGSETAPEWMDTKPDSFMTNYTIEANLKTLAQKLEELGGTTIRTRYYIANFDVIILFGATELKAQVAWLEDGVEKRSPAKIVPMPV